MFGHCQYGHVSCSYSTTWLARALPTDGRIVSFEVDAKHAAIARQNLDSCGVGGIAEIIIGSAAETLPAFEPQHKFDLAFIDADKQNNLLYFREAKRIVRKGGVIVRTFDVL
jgi:predicted O-methyltransferase YrrM